ncbi:MAG: TOBE domain-containing protein [Cyclobacteriaceae bacterium]
MESRIEPGNVVWVFKIGLEGEITKVEAFGRETRYHVRIPSDDDVYVYSREDLHLFPKMAEENIRKEWGQKPS